jgi:hypothetical protein
MKGSRNKKWASHSSISGNCRERRKMKIIFRLMCKFHSRSFWFITSLPVAKLLDRVRFGSLKLLCMQFYYLEEFSSSISYIKLDDLQKLIVLTRAIERFILSTFRERVLCVSCTQGHAISTNYYNFAVHINFHSPCEQWNE